MRVSSTSSPSTNTRRASVSISRPLVADVRSATRARAAAAQHGTDAGRDLRGAEGLDDVVVGAELEADDPVGLGAAGGDHHDRHGGFAPQRAAHVAAVDVGQAEVEQHEVRIGLAREPQRVGTRRGDQRLEALADQGVLERLGDRRLVLDQQDARPGHELPRLAPSAAGVIGSRRAGHRGKPAAAALPKLCPRLGGAWVDALHPRRTPPKEPIVSRITSHVAIAAAALVAGGLGATAFSEPGRRRAPCDRTLPGARPTQVRTVVVTKTIHRVRHVRVHPHLRRRSPRRRPRRSPWRRCAPRSPSGARVAVARPLPRSAAASRRAPAATAAAAAASMTAASTRAAAMTERRRAARGRRARARSPPAALALFLSVLVLLAWQVRSGRDPALGAGRQRPCAVAQAPPRRVLVRKIVRRVIDEKVVERDDAPRPSSPAVPAAAARRRAARRPPSCTRAPAPAPAPAPAAPIVTKTS